MPADVVAVRREFYVDRQRRIRTAVLAAQQQWSRLDPDALRPSWQVVAPAILAIVLAAQADVAEQSTTAVAAMLTAQNITVDNDVQVRTGAFQGAADGRALGSLLEHSLALTLTQIGQGFTARQGMAVGRRFLTTAVGSEISDAARQSRGVATAAQRKVGGAVRVLTPPSCPRCAVLGGRWYRWSTGFQRHPRCDCDMVPARSSAELLDDARLWTAQSYFDSLSPAQQDRIFTAAGAQAIREGADIAQVVNARRGMTTTVIGRRQVRVTREGTSRRGRAYASVGDRPRLLPEEIYRVATSRDDAIRLLIANGYLVG